MQFLQKTHILLTSFVIINFIASVFSHSQIQENELFRRESIESILRHLEPINFLQKYTDISQNSTECHIDLGLYFSALQHFEIWALKMLDASSKIPAGILEGNFVDYGMFDECISIRGNFSSKKNSAKHCLYSLDIILSANQTLDLHPKFSICLPSSCDIEDVESIINKLNQLIHQEGSISKEFNIKLMSASCSNLDYEKWSTGSIITTSVISIIIIFLVCCTILECSQNWIKENNLDNKVFSHLARFSLFNSSLRIFSTNHNSGTITAIHGIRALSICWVVYGHEVYYNYLSSYVNLGDFMHWTESWKSIYLSMGIFSVDTFFLLSGFLLSYHFLKKMSGGASWNIFEYYLHRYIRLTPAVFALLAIATYIAPYLGSGPIWETDIVTNMSEECESNWWKFILYVQNYGGDARALKCMGHLWYLAVDMQLFWLSPLILYPLAKKPMIGLIILGVFFTTSLITPGIILSENDLTFNTLALHLGQKTLIDSNLKLYIVTHCRASPWLFGIFFGYIMYLTINTKPKRNQLIFGWITATICFGFCTLGFAFIIDQSYEYNKLWESIFTAVSRAIWAMGISWIIYACHHGYGGVINKFLSLPIFLPISRISYSVYLLHFLVQSLRSSSTRIPVYFSDFLLLQSFLSDFIVCIVAAFFFCIIFESPVLILEKIIFRKKSEGNKSRNKIQINGDNKPEMFEKGSIFDNTNGRFRHSLEKNAENRLQNGADIGSLDKVEKGETIVDPNTHELTTDL